jgi:TusA-related sulfurtransferase
MVAHSATLRAVDVRGMTCAIALADVALALAQDEGSIEVLCDHPTTVHETIPEYCKMNGYRCTITPEIYPLHMQTYRVRIEPPSRG